MAEQVGATGERIEGTLEEGMSEARLGHEPASPSTRSRGAPRRAVLCLLRLSFCARHVCIRIGRVSLALVQAAPGSPLSLADV